MKAHLGDDARLAAEARARALIDRQLNDAGWIVQDKKALNLFAAQGVACREVTMKTGDEGQVVEEVVPTSVGPGTPPVAHCRMMLIAQLPQPKGHHIPH